MKKHTFAILLAVFGLSSLAQTLSTGLQACYPFDLSANNAASTGPLLNGTISNASPATGHTGLPNTAYRLNGSTSSYIALPDQPGLKNNDLFFTGWFYIDSLPYEQYLVYTKNSCNYNFEAYSLITYNDPWLNQQVFRVSKSNSFCQYAPQVNSVTAPQTGNWYHVCFFVDQSNIKLYVNGTLEGSTSHNILYNYQSGKQVFLGVTNESNFNLPFKGRIDDVRFYNRELSASEVSQLYRIGAPCEETEPGTDVGLNNLLPGKNSLALFPNPSQGTFKIKAQGFSRVAVFNSSGQATAFSAVYTDSGIEINLPNAPEGLYLVVLQDASGAVAGSGKLLLDR